MEKANKTLICCPDRLPKHVPNHNFPEPCDCPEQIDSPRFSSPNSSFGPEKLERLQACIEKLNNLLLALANSDDTQNLEAFRLFLKQLRGCQLTIMVICGDSECHLSGSLVDVGANYMESRTGDLTILIPFDSICSIGHDQETCNADHEVHQELLKIDPCLRLNLVLNFGPTVAANPRLFNIFFGLSLDLRLSQLIDNEIMVTIENCNDSIVGTLKCVNIDFLELEVNSIIKRVSLNEICFIETEL